MEVFGEEYGKTALLEMNFRFRIFSCFIKIKVSVRMTFYAFPGIKNCLNPDPFFFAFHFILNINKINKWKD